MNIHTLEAQKRTISGRKVKNLRKTGIIPATMYGKGIASESIQLNAKVFEKTLKETGETGLLTLTVDAIPHSVLISHIQKHPVSGDVLHVEFRQVNLKEKVKAKIPVEIVGEPVAVKENIGTLLTLLNDIEVEALPTDLPEKFEVDVSKLAAVDESIFIKDLTVSPGVKILTDSEQMVAKIGELLAPEPEPTPVTATEGETEPAEHEAGEKPELEEAGEKPLETPEEKK